MMRSLRTITLALSFVVFSCCAATACTELRDWLSVCTEGSDWEARSDADGDILFRNDVDGYSAQLIVYNGGTATGLEIEDAAQFVTERDAGASEEYKILGRGKMPSGNIVFTSYALRSGVERVYANTLSMGKNETLRIVTWRRGKEGLEADRVAHLGFGTLVKVKGTR